MNKKVIAAASSIFLCVTGVAMGQILQSSKQSGMGGPKSADRDLGVNIMPLTPKQLADSKRRVVLDAAAAAALDAGQYDVAEEDARQSMSHGLGAGISQEILASALYAQGKTEEALQAYKAMADEGEDAPRNLLPYALLLLKTGHWVQAVAAYDKQLPFLAENKLMIANSHFSPTIPQPRELATAIYIALGLTYGSGDSWGKHSQDDKAMTQFRQALTLAPDSALAHLYYGRQLQRLGRGTEAQTAFKKAAELSQGDVKAAAEQALK